MNNELLYPFKNLELYLRSIDDKLDTFYHSFSIEPFALRVTNVDRINMQVTMLKDIYVDDEKSEQIFSFSKGVSVIVLNFLTEGFENINKGLDFQQKISKQKILFYLDNINIQVSKIFRKDLIDKYPFLYHYKDGVVNFVKKFDAYKNFKGIIYIKSGDTDTYGATGHVDLLYSDWGNDPHIYQTDQELDDYIESRYSHGLSSWFSDAKLSVSVWITEYEKKDVKKK